MDLAQVEEVLDLEKKAFLDDAKEVYVQLMSELGLGPRINDCIILVGSSLPKMYLEAALNGLSAHKAVFITGKGPELAKAITVAEQVKHQAKGRIVQFNRASLHSSLINPAYKPAMSRKNVSVFFDDSCSDSLSHEQQERDALREIKGYKVYQTPSMSILLLAGDTNKTVEGWTKQVEEVSQKPI